MRKFNLLSMIVLTAILTACGQAPKRKLPHRSDQQSFLKINLADNPETLDPRLARMLRDLTIAKQVFEGLMRLDGHGKPQPAIAQTIEISEDAKTYTFRLRHTHWSNGDPVTAHDFVYSWSKVLDPCFCSDYSHMLYPIKNGRMVREGKCPVEALGLLAADDLTLIVHLEEPTPYFFELLAFPTYFPIHHTMDEQDSLWSYKDSHFIGNGPFLISSWKPNDELLITKNPRYWDHDAVKLEGIKFSMIADSNTEAELYEKNELDWLGQPISNNISPDFALYLKKAGKLASYPIAGTCWFTFNNAKPPFNDLRLRKAFSYAIQRAEIIEHILQGDQRAATSPIPSLMKVLPNSFFKDGDTESALALFETYLKEKNLDRNHFPEIQLLHLPNERNAKIAQVVQQQWQQLFGIVVHLERVERKVCREKISRGDFDVGAGQWIADFNDPIAFLEIFKNVEGGMNDAHWENPQFIELLNQSKMENNSEKRLALLQEAENIFMSDMPIAPLYEYTFDYVKKDCVKNVILSPLGIADFKHTEISATPSI